jgi:subtilisin-like proprotein convertase family protein
MKCSSVTSRFHGHGRVLGLLGAATLGLAGAATTAQAQCGTYNITQASGGTIIPGTDDTGCHFDDGVTAGVPLPFGFTFYGNTYNSVNISSNGTLQFDTTNAAYFNDGCVTPDNSFGTTIFPFWDDLYTFDTANGEGVFTSTTGTAPNRQFHIEYRTVFCCTAGVPVTDFEIRLFEGSSSFDVIYMNPTNDPRIGGNSATIGVKNADGSQFTQYSCDTALGFTDGTILHFTAGNGSGPPANNLAFNPASGPVGATFLATSQVTPGCGPPSTGLAVSLDASSINSGTIAMHDDGLNGDAVAGDNIFSANVTVGAGATVGAHSLTATVTDAQGRSGNHSSNFNVSGANDDCAGAVPAVIGNNPFDNSAATTSAPAATCGALGTDLWYTLTSETAGSLSVTTCGLTGGDSAIAIYDNDCNTALACNDDSCGLQSNVCMAIQANHTYLLRIGGFAGSIWSGSFNVNVSTAGYNPPGDAVPEGEDCNQIYPDNFNGGCNSAPVVYSNAEFCTDYSGTCANNTSFRDTDWWMFNLPTADTVTVHGQANFAAQCFFVNPTCPGALFPGTPIANPGGCSPDFSISFALPAGPNVFFISPAGFDGSAQCGVASDYWFRIELASNPNCDPYGACCSSTGCTVNTQAGCTASGGTYNGNGSHCSSCPATGACCTADGCSIITAAACSASGGSYQGDNSSCPVGAPNSYSRDPNMGIPDAGPPVSDTNTVSDSYTVTHMAVRVTIPDHTYVQDLTVDLTHNGTTVHLWNLQCGSNDGLDVTFDDSGTTVVCGQPTTGTFQPNSPLSAFTGMNVNGDWTITCQDHVGADVGTLTHWDMAINGPGSCGPSCDSADFDCDGDVGTDFDIQAFFACLAGNCPGGSCPNDADFNNDGDVGTDADIEAFFRVLAGNPC